MINLASKIAHLTPLSFRSSFRLTRKLLHGVFNSPSIVDQNLFHSCRTWWPSICQCKNCSSIFFVLVISYEFPASFAISDSIKCAKSRLGYRTPWSNSEFSQQYANFAGCRTHITCRECRERDLRPLSGNRAFRRRNLASNNADTRDGMTETDCDVIKPSLKLHR